MPAKLDLGDLVRSGELTLGPEEDPEDKASRRRIEGRAAFIDHCKDVAIFVALYLFVILMVLISLYFLVIAQSVSPENQKWFQTILTALLSGSVSFSDVDLEQSKS
jgi:hypothetical protein